MTERDIKKALLRKFYKNDVWGKHHLREDTLAKGFPPHFRHHVMEIAEELRKNGFLIKFPTSHGTQWYANIEKIREIEEIINV